MKVLPLYSHGDARAALPEVQAHLAAGGILAYPTETVYGFGTLLDQPATERLADLKGRSLQKPFLVLAARPRRLPGITWTPVASLLADRFWPGPLSLALRADERYRAPVLSAEGTVAVRDTPLEPLRMLLLLLDQPITSTSANLPGQPPATRLPEVLETLARFPQQQDVLVLDGGDLPPSAPSTVVDCSGDHARLLREGAIALPELRAVLQPQGFAIDVG